MPRRPRDTRRPRRTRRAVGIVVCIALGAGALAGGLVAAHAWAPDRITTVVETGTPDQGGLSGLRSLGTAVQPSTSASSSAGPGAATLTGPSRPFTVPSQAELTRLGMSLVMPRASDAVVDSYGINVKTGSGQGVYSQTGTVLSKLRALGVRHIRTAIWHDRPSQYRFVRSLGAAGIRFDIIAGGPTNAAGTPELLVATAAREFPRSIESFEGANEWNLSGRVNWAAEDRAHQLRLYKAVKSTATVASVPVLAPSLGMRKDRDILGDLAGMADLGNNHLYPGGFPPSRLVDEQLAAEASVVPGKPVIVTEAGYHDAMATTQTHFPTPDDVAGVYFPRLLMEYFSRRVPRVYSYELVDQGTSTTNREQRFGLLRNDWSPKPAYTAMRNLLDLASDPGPSFTRRALAYGLSGAPTDLRQSLVQRRDGSYTLFLWPDDKIWDPKARKRMSVSSESVTLKLPDAATVQMFRPSESAAAVRTWTGTSTLTINLDSDLVALTLRR